jgi:hypothetical protein
MASFNKFDIFAQNVGRGVHNLNANALKVGLSNVAPNASTNVVFGDMTEISAVNGYTAGGNTPTNSGYGQTGGVGKLVLQDTVFTASGGAIGPFRYAFLYDSTPSSPNKPLIGWWDYGSSITLADGETFTVDMDQANGALTIT